MNWSIKNYNVFLREVKRQTGATHSQAQKAYRDLSAKLGTKLYGADVKRNPNLVERAVKAAKRKPKEKKKPTGGGPGPMKQIRIGSIDDWVKYQSDYVGETEDMEFETSADY